MPQDIFDALAANKKSSEPQDIFTQLAQQPAPQPQQGTPAMMPADAGLRGPLTMAERAKNFARDRVQNLPMLGTVVGGMVGGIPGAAGGAALGAGIRKATDTSLGGGGGIELSGQGAIDTAKEMGMRGLQGAALETGGKVLGNAMSTALSPAVAAGSKAAFGAPTVNRWLQVAPKEMEYGANPGSRLIKEGLVRTTKTATRDAIKPALDDAGAQLGTALTTATQKGHIVDASDIVQDGLDSATKTIGKRSDEAFQKILYQHLNDVLKQFPDIDKLTPLRAQELKKAIGDAIKWHGTPYEGDVNQALVEIYQGLNTKLKAFEGVDPLQKRWGDLYLGSKAADEAVIRDLAGQGSGNLHPWIKRGAAALPIGGAAGAELLRLTRGQ